MDKKRLLGTVDAKVDVKGRVFLPVIFRRCLSAGENYRLMMRKDVFEDCLVLYTEEEWYKRLDDLRSRLSIWNRKHQDTFRRFVADADWVTLDVSGRFLIPKRYLKMVGIDQEITFIGMDDTIEIWAKGRNISSSEDALGDVLEGLMDESE